MSSNRDELTCREFVDFIGAYIAEELPSGQLTEFSGHMELCPSCEVYVNTYRETMSLGKAACATDDAPVPDDVPEGLVRAILAARRRGDA